MALTTSTTTEAEADKRLQAEACIDSTFEPKRLTFTGGDSLDALLTSLGTEGFAVTCRKGHKPKQPNQDSCFFGQFGWLRIIGVADGHGEDGHWVSHWTTQFAMSIVVSELSGLDSLPADEVTLLRIFNTVYEVLQLRADSVGFDIQESGSTLTLCLIDVRRREILTAWTGDSRCIHCRSSSAEVQELSFDHKPDMLEERKRIYAAGGKVVGGRSTARVCLQANHSDFEGLNMSRSLGDALLHRVGVTHQPSIKRIVLPEEPATGGHFALCCSDGVWEVLSNEEAAAIIRDAGRENAAEAVSSLVCEARDRWRKGDTEATVDITAIVAWL